MGAYSEPGRASRMELSGYGFQRLILFLERGAVRDFFFWGGGGVEGVLNITQG